MTPSIGRIVHYVRAASTSDRPVRHEHLAAIVTAFLGTDDDGYERVHLCAFQPNGMLFRMDVREDQTHQRADTWHWPEREAE